MKEILHDEPAKGEEDGIQFDDKPKLTPKEIEVAKEIYTLADTLYKTAKKEKGIKGEQDSPLLIFTVYPRDIEANSQLWGKVRRVEDRMRIFVGNIWDIGEDDGMVDSKAFLCTLMVTSTGEVFKMEWLGNNNRNKDHAQKIWGGRKRPNREDALATTVSLLQQLQ